VRYLHHGMDDAGQQVPHEWFEGRSSEVEAAYDEDPDAFVLTGCHVGIDRAASLGSAVPLAQGWDPVEATSAPTAGRLARGAADTLTRHHARSVVDAGDPCPGTHVRLPGRVGHAAQDARWKPSRAAASCRSTGRSSVEVAEPQT
jgi:hypothetical protein